MSTLISYRAECYSPFEQGGNFNRAKMDTNALLMEMLAEREDVRSRTRLYQERLAMLRKQIVGCDQEATVGSRRGSTPWLIAAAVMMVLSLIFTVSTESACSRAGTGGFFLILALICAGRWVSECYHQQKNEQRHSERIADYKRECEQLNEQLDALNLRDAELTSSIKAAQRYQK